MPDVEMMMGTGNLTELTEADTSGITAMLLGLCSELHIRNVLVVQVSPHTRRTVAEHDAARRLMFAARSDDALPKGYGAGLAQVHDLKPFPTSPPEIAERAADVRDMNYRIEVADDGIHLYNRDGHHIARDAMALFPHLAVKGDDAHAFYLGTELMKAELAFSARQALCAGRAARFRCRDGERGRRSDDVCATSAIHCAPVHLRPAGIVRAMRRCTVLKMGACSCRKSRATFSEHAPKET